MKTYRITTHDEEAGLCHFWYGTKSEAKVAMRQLSRRGQEALLEACNVPTEKKLLIRFLNDYTVTQDGYGDVSWPEQEDES